MSPFAMRSLCLSFAFSFITARSSRSFSSSFGFRPGFCAAMPDAPRAPSCWRHAERWEL